MKRLVKYIPRPAEYELPPVTPLMIDRDSRREEVAGTVLLDGINRIRPAGDGW